VIAAVVFAMPAEFAPWRRRHTFQPTVATGLSVFEAQIGATCVRVVTSGIGAPNAATLVKAIHAGGADVIVVAGVGGGLKPEHAAGEILVPRRVRSGHGGRDTVVNGRLLSVAADAGATIVEAFVSVDRIVARAEEKARLGRQGDVVDMESLAVLGEAESLRLPAVAIRVVADTASEDLPMDFMRAIRPDGAIHARAVLLEIISHPARWPAIVRFGLSNRRALTRLAVFLDRFVPAIGAPNS
jgi:4-hydroxy-3-methylbut-2-enyl diphosphate reductase